MIGQIYLVFYTIIAAFTALLAFQVTRYIFAFGIAVILYYIGSSLGFLFAFAHLATFVFLAPSLTFSAVIEITERVQVKQLITGLVVASPLETVASAIETASKHVYMCSVKIGYMRGNTMF